MRRIIRYSFIAALCAAFSVFICVLAAALVIEKTVLFLLPFGLFCVFGLIWLILSILPVIKKLIWLKICVICVCAAAAAAILIF